jgi:hypothetical protein
LPPPPSFHIRMCRECLSSLDKGKVPPSSLVRFDAGSIPSGPDLHLVPLTVFEQNLVGLNHFCACVFVMKAAMPSDEQQARFKKHCIAFKAGGPDELARCLLPMDLVPSVMSAIFITVGNASDVMKLCKEAKIFNVRGRELVKWAVHLTKV